MLFGLRKTPAWSQQAMNIILSRVVWQLALVYLSHIMVYSILVTRHIRNCAHRISATQDCRVTLQLSKCSTFDNTVSYLEHTIRTENPTVESRNCEAMRKSLPPTRQMELRSSLGIARVKSRFISSLNQILVPLNVQMAENHPSEFELSVVKLDAAPKRKENLIFEPILALPQHREQNILGIDACSYQTESALSSNSRTEVGYQEKCVRSEEELISHRKKLPRCDREHSYSPILAERGNLHIAYGPARVKINSHPSELIWTVCLFG